MSKILFLWNTHHNALINEIQNLRVRSSCEVKQAYIGNHFGQNNREKQAIKGEKLQLQLRQSMIVVYDHYSEKIVDYFQCNLRISFSVREVKEFYQQCMEMKVSKQKTLSVIQFNHQNYPQQQITFVIPPQNKKALEQFGIALEKCSIIQKDFHSKFKPIRKLGKGRTASVFAALRHRDCSTVAIKAFNKSSHFALQDGKGKVTKILYKKAFEKELKILASSDCQNLCQFQGVYETDNSLYIVMKIYDQTLSSVLYPPPSLQREWIIEVMQDLLKGVAYLHANGIMHRDLKLQNIMLKNTEDGAKAVIIDLGIAEYFNEQTYLFDHCGTIGYVAPQIFGPKPPHPEKCDIFSLGVVFYMLLFKKSLFIGQTKQQITMNNKMGKLGLDMALLNEEDELIRDLLLRMLQVDNTKRISADQALNHQLFIQSNISPSLSTSSTHVSNPKILSFMDI